MIASSKVQQSEAAFDRGDLIVDSFRFRFATAVVPPQPPPHPRVDLQRRHSPRLRVEKGSMMCELSVAKEPRQHRQSGRRECLVDEWLLSVERLDIVTCRCEGCPASGTAHSH